MTDIEKENLKRELVQCLADELEVRKIVVFGSFPTSSEPNDIDVAIFQDSDEEYLPLALKYRRKTRAIAKTIPLDIIPLRANVKSFALADEIARGDIIYER